MSIKSIPLKTWEVQAILDDRKTVTRRVVKMDRPSIYKAACSAGKWSETFGGEIPDEIADWYAREVAKPPYKPGDILWVRETFCPIRVIPTRYAYRCGFPEADVRKVRWHPSIHMPREAARLFLRVKSVRVERLREIDNAGAKAEGVTAETDNSGKMHLSLFVWLWNSTIKPADLPRYGWDANPWIYVIEFERIAKDEAMQQMSGIKT